MRQSWRLATSALLVVTGLVTIPSERASAWKVDVGEQLTTMVTAGENLPGAARQGRRERDSVVHRVGQDDFSMSSWADGRSYAQPSVRDQASGDRSDRTMQEKASGEHPLGTAPRSGNYLQNDTTDQRNANDRGPYPYSYPYSSFGGGVPSTHGDPLVQELSREPSPR